MTLLEVLIAIAMTAILTAALFAALSIAFDARGRARALSSGPSKFTAAIGIIERDLENALPRPGASGTDFSVDLDTGGFSLGTFAGSLASSGALAEVFDGESTSLAFSVLATDPASDGELLSEGIRRVTLFAEDDGEEGVRLVRRIERNLLASSSVAPPDEVLVSGLSEVSFRYFDGGGWSSSTTTLSGEHPAAVEVTLAEGDVRLVAVVPVGVDSGNTIDLSVLEPLLQLGGG